MKLTEVARFVADVTQAVAFYRTLLGAEPSYADSSVATFRKDGVTFLIHERYTPGPGELPCEDHVAFSVASVDATVEALVAKGLSIEFATKDYAWGRSAYLRDPDGSLIEITECEDFGRSG